MIYRIIEDATGHVIKSVDVPNVVIAKKYLEPGQSLIIAGTDLHINDDLLYVSGNTLARRPGVEGPPIHGEGLDVKIVWE